MSESYLVIELNHQPVELCKLLKIANLVSGGGEAKIVISEGYVLLNGEVEYQKRKKVYHEDVIEFNGEVVQLLVNEALTESEQ
jgi:ribosome-associated protein